MASTFQYRLMNSSLMRKYQNTPGRMFVKIFEAACGGKQVISKCCKKIIY